jgi:hypothetical protein
MVVAAFTEQRYDLGEALARLCGRAWRMERDRKLMPAPVPVSPGPTNPGYPEGSGPDTPCPLCGVAMGQPGCNDNTHPSAAEGMQPQPADADATAVQRVIPSTRCVAIIGDAGGQRECHAVLYWAEGREVGGGWQTSGWEHLDGLHDHIPVPFSNRPVTL